MGKKKNKNLEKCWWPHHLTFLTAKDTQLKKFRKNFYPFLFWKRKKPDRNNGRRRHVKKISQNFENVSQAFDKKSFLGHCGALGIIFERFLNSDWDNPGKSPYGFWAEL